MHFGKLDDSPMFRKQLQDLEEGTEALKERCFKFYKGCRKYTEDLGEAYDGDIAFASALESFGGGHDDPISMAVGGPVFTKFTIALREIGTYKEVLRSQVESILSERLINFATSDLQDIKEVRKRFDKASIHYDQAREKFLSLKKGTKPDIVSEVEEDLRNARSSFEQARFNLVAALSSIEAKKKFEFLESVSATMDAHLRYFKQAYELLLQMEPYIHQVLSYAQQSRQQAIYEQAALAARMQEFRQQMEMENQRPFSDVEASPTGDGIHRIGRSSHKMIEAVMQSTPKGKVQTIKQGYLLKRSSSLRGDWKRRFFVLDSRGKLYYYHEHWSKPMGNSGHNRFSGRLHSSERHSGLLGRFLHNNHGSPQNNKTVAHHTVDLLTSTIKLDAEQTDLRFCFRIISPTKNYSLQAENAMERMDWIDKITGVIASLLNSHVSDKDTYSQRLPLCHLKNSQQLTGSECSSLSSSCELDPVLCEEMGGTRAQYKSYHEHQAGPHYTSSELQERPIDLLRRVSGNDLCADCNFPEPDWASLNLGILLCIECSGVHRNLGVQVSKVRSLTLDVKVWEPSVITLFQSLGNQFCNSVWEESLLEHDNAVWDISGSSGPFSSRSDSKSGKLKIKPSPADTLAIKEKYIYAKYMEKQFISSRDDSNGDTPIACRIWSSVLSQNKQLVYRLLVLEDADVNTTYEQALEGSQYEIQNAVVSNHWSKSPGSGEQDMQGWTLLHLACFNGDIGMIELLIQYGAQVNAVDQWGRTPLHQCSLHGRSGCAKILLSRGANRELVDTNGKTAFQLAVEHEANAVEELLS